LLAAKKAHFSMPNLLYILFRASSAQTVKNHSGFIEDEKFNKISKKTFTQFADESIWKGETK